MDFKFLVQLIPSNKLQVVSIDWASFTLPKSNPHQSSTSLDELFGLSDAEIRLQNSKAKIEFAKSQIQKQVGDYIVIASIDPNNLENQRLSWMCGEMCRFNIFSKENEFIVKIVLGQLVREIIMYSWPLLTLQLIKAKSEGILRGVSPFFKNHFIEEKKFSSIQNAIQYAVNINNQMVSFIQEQKDEIAREHINIPRGYVRSGENREYYRKKYDMLDLLFKSE